MGVETSRKTQEDVGDRLPWTYLYSDPGSIFAERDQVMEKRQLEILSKERAVEPPSSLPWPLPMEQGLGANSALGGLWSMVPTGAMLFPRRLQLCEAEEH